jgi:hypothetical protein
LKIEDQKNLTKKLKIDHKFFKNYKQPKNGVGKKNLPKKKSSITNNIKFQLKKRPNESWA